MRGARYVRRFFKCELELGLDADEIGIGRGNLPEREIEWVGLRSGVRSIDFREAGFGATTQLSVWKLAMGWNWEALGIVAYTVVSG